MEMPSDRKKLYIICFSVLTVLLLLLFAPSGSGRTIAAILLLPTAVATWILIKKRVILSINSKTVWMLLGIIGFLYFTFYYVSAAAFGLTRTGYGLKLNVIFGFIIPIGVIIVTTELIRYVICSQRDRIASSCAFFIGLATDILICSTISNINSFATFMDVVGLTFFPGLLYNLLYNYLAVRYGFVTNIIYKGFTVWAFYLIPYGSGISDSIIALVNIFLPVVIYFFIDSLFERKRRYALGQRSRFSRAVSKIITAVAVIIMIGTVMLISNHFYYGALVVATESMTGEINKGDVVITESYEDQTVTEGQVIVFADGDSKYVHRVVDIQIINGIKRYYTKGDANEDMDAGYITDSDIVGLVNYKIPAIGYPTLWLRGLFDR